MDIHQRDLKTALGEHLEQREPVDPVGSITTVSMPHWTS
jgi:hypothetical protein